MRKHLSVLALWSRLTLGRVLGVLAVMAAAQAALFRLALAGNGDGGVYSSFEQLLERSGAGWAAIAAFLLVMGLLTLSGCELRGSRLDCTLRRLSIREETAVLWQAVSNAVCLLLFWAVETTVLLGLCLWYTRAAPGFITEQSVFLACYRVNTLHSLLPLEDWALYLRNIVFLAVLALDAACAGLHQRRGGFAASPVILALLAVWFVPNRFIFASGLEVGLAMAGVGLIPLAIDLAYLRIGREEEAADEA